LVEGGLLFRVAIFIFFSCSLSIQYAIHAFFPLNTSFSLIADFECMIATSDDPVLRINSASLWFDLSPWCGSGFWFLFDADPDFYLTQIRIFIWCGSWSGSMLPKWCRSRSWCGSRSGCGSGSTTLSDVAYFASYDNQEAVIMYVQYLMLLIIGIFSGFWMWTEKTMQTWANFFRYTYCVNRTVSQDFNMIFRSVPVRIGSEFRLSHNRPQKRKRKGMSCFWKAGFFLWKAGTFSRIFKNWW